MSDNRRIWFALFVLTVFCAGLAGGIFMGRRMVPDIPRGPGMMGGPFPGPRPGMGPPGAMMLERLSEALKLTTEQRDRLADILKASRERAAIAQSDVRAQFEADQQRLRDDIRAILTTEQQPLFQQWIEQGPRGRAFGPGRGRESP